MATKAELEIELADLRRQLAERDERAEAAAKQEPEQTQDEHAPDPVDDQEQVDWEQELTELIEGFDEMTHKKPLLFALGAFTVGFLIGRSK